MNLEPCSIMPEAGLGHRLLDYRQRTAEFFFKPVHAKPLAALRIGLACILLVQAYMMRRDCLEFFAENGFVQRPLAAYLGVAHTPSIAWIVKAFAHWNIGESACIYSVSGAYVVALVLMLFGLWTRLSTLSAWFLHWLLMYSSYATNYGVDLFAHVFLFYLMFLPAGAAWSLDVKWRGVNPAATPMARLGLRIIQLHLCIMYLASGLEKATGIQWWNGELLWRALQLPVYRQFDMSWLAHYPLLPMIGGWTTLMVETLYCIFIWPRRTRRLWIFAICCLHGGIIVFLGLSLFGATMCILTLSAFGVSTEPRCQAEASHWQALILNRRRPAASFS